MNVEACVTFWYLFKTKIFFFLIFLPFFRHPSTQTIKVIGLIFFPVSWPWKFQPYTYSLRPFSRRGGGRQTPPQAMHRFRPPSLYRVKQKDLSTRWWTIKVFKGNVVNRELPSSHWGSLKSTRTVPLNHYPSIFLF